VFFDTLLESEKTGRWTTGRKSTTWSLAVGAIARRRHCLEMPTTYFVAIFVLEFTALVFERKGVRLQRGLPLPRASELERLKSQ
jgi:hypothetical protein